MYPDQFATDITVKFDDTIKRWLERHIDETDGGKPEPIKVILKNRRNGLQFEFNGYVNPNRPI